MTTEPIILMIEDDPDWRYIIKGRLKKFPCVVEVAENLMELDRKLTRDKLSKYSLITLDPKIDVNLGIWSGLDVLQHVSEYRLKIPVIIISGYENWGELVKNLEPYSQILQERIFSKGNFNLVWFDKLVGELLGFQKSSQRVETSRQRLEEGLVYGFCFLRIDIKDHSNLVKKHATQDVEGTLDSFELLVEEKVKARQGQIWSWHGDGGLCAFNMADCVQGAVLSAIEIIGNLTEFNANRDKNKIGEDVGVRTAVHYGTAKYRHEKGRIHSEAINFVSHLESQMARPNSICISYDAWKESPDQIRSKFKEDQKKFEGKKIYHWTKQ